MLLRSVTAALASLCLALPVAAQQLNGMSAASTRGETRIMVATEDFSTFSLASLTYGQPEWKDSYDGMLDRIKGRVNRLGKDGLTTLFTFSELEIGGTKIAPGSYIVALHCDKDGKFGLALLDSTKAAKEKVFPGADFKPDILAPLTLNKGAAKESVAKMTMTFDAQKDGAGKGTFTIAWGKHTLTAPCQLHAPK
ncbi:MAG: DUF2911 domain-containing protein [Planctomycetes bacterium]|nr:DUF2911 domain-containing protein [Planctomycetota bacterium]